MEKRKVISLGKASYAIILPKDWIRANNVKKQDELFVFAHHRDGRIIVQKELQSHSSVRIPQVDAISPEILRFAIQASYILNIDDVTLCIKNQENFSEILNCVTEISRNFQGINSSYSEDGIHLKCLIDMKTINIPKIFEEIFFIFKLMMYQIQTGVVADNKNQIDDMERKYILGVRYLIYTLQTHYRSEEGEGGLDHVIQTLGYRLCLKVIRNLAIQTNILEESLDGTKIPALSKIVDDICALTEEAIQLILNPDFEKLKRVEETYQPLKAKLSDIEIGEEEYHEALLNFVTFFTDSINTFLHTAMARFLESKIGLIEPEEDE